MELVKLKMRGIYKVFMFIIAILILLILVLGGFYIVYSKIESSSADIEVNSSLSINYKDGKNISVSKKKTIKFSITNEGNDESFYNIGFTKINGSANYKLYSSDSLLLEGTIKGKKDIYTDFISINSKVTNNYELEIINNGKNEFSAILEIKVKENLESNFIDKILSDNEIKEPASKVGSEIAITDEGLIKDSDDLGTTYYFRGKVLNNYVTFANMLWRIVRINGDNSIRLVLDSELETVSSYYLNESPKFDYNSSNIKETLITWYQEKLEPYTKYIVNTKYCNDIIHDEQHNFNTYTRLFINKIPTFNCLGTSIDSNIGLLTADEIVFAGGVMGQANREYYLYSDSNLPIYTMSGAKGDGTYINMFMLDVDGSLSTIVNGNLFRNVKPVISIVKMISFSGNGTKDNPYVIETN